MIAKRSLLFMILAACWPFAAAPVAAQPYPHRPVKIVVPFAASGSSDMAARIVADHLSRAFGQQFYVENRSGSGGTIGIEAVARSAPDGYTLLVTTDTVANAPHVLKMSIDPLKDLAPVVQLSRQGVVLAVHPSLGVASVAELVALAKQRSDLTYVTSGLSSPQDMVAQWFGQIAGIKLEHVLYRGGGQAINDLIAGHVKIGSLGLPPILAHYKAGALRVLAQSTEARSPILPEVPTYQEAGVKNLVLEQWVGVFLPAGTPPAIGASLNAEINKLLANPTVRETFLRSGQEPVGGSDAEFLQRFRHDYEKYRRLVKDLGIKTE
jgi:tripartite-type tricarboxylate transporter receptor subunit TctC